MTNNRLKTFVFTYDYKVTAHTLKEANESRQNDDGFYIRPYEFTYNQILIPTSEEVLDYEDDTISLIDSMYEELSNVTDPVERKVLVRSIHKEERKLENK